jgi:uncharacterized OsmC-like protein
MSLVEVIEGTRQAVSADTRNGQVVFRTQQELVGVTEVTGTTGSGHRVTVDEPAGLGGGNVAPNPVEFALAALGSCQAITYRFWAEQLGIRFDTLAVDVEGDLDVRGFFGIDPTVRPGYEQIRVTLRITGPETDERYQELQRAVDEHCPVLDLFANPVPVSLQLTIN